MAICKLPSYEQSRVIHTEQDTTTSNGTSNQPTNMDDHQHPQVATTDDMFIEIPTIEIEQEITAMSNGSKMVNTITEVHKDPQDIRMTPRAECTVRSTASNGCEYDEMTSNRGASQLVEDHLLFINTPLNGDCIEIPTVDDKKEITHSSDASVTIETGDNLDGDDITMTTNAGTREISIVIDELRIAGGKDASKLPTNMEGPLIIATTSNTEAIHTPIAKNEQDNNNSQLSAGIEGHQVPLNLSIPPNDVSTDIATRTEDHPSTGEKDDSKTVTTNTEQQHRQPLEASKIKSLPIQSRRSQSTTTTKRTYVFTVIAGMTLMVLVSVAMTGVGIGLGNSFSGGNTTGQTLHSTYQGQPSWIAKLSGKMWIYIINRIIISI